MGNLQINTTQNVNLDYKIVSIGERIVAFLIDGFILYMYAYLANLIGDAIGYIYEDTWTQRGLVALIFLPAMFYSLLMHSLFNGQTVGKMLMKMRVVRLDGTPVHWSNLLVRWMLRLVDIWIFLGSIGILSGDQHQKEDKGFPYHFGGNQRGIRAPIHQCDLVDRQGCAVDQGNLSYCQKEWGF